jgi:hypothetical protein
VSDCRFHGLVMPSSGRTRVASRRTAAPTLRWPWARRMPMARNAQAGHGAGGRCRCRSGWLASSPLSLYRDNGETRRRVKLIGRLPGEHSCLSPVWAVLDRASKSWRRLTMTPGALCRLQDLRRHANCWPNHPVTTATRRWSPRLSPPPRNITPEPASRAVYTAPETPPGASRTGGSVVNRSPWLT